MEFFKKKFKMTPQENCSEPKYPYDNLYIAEWEGFHEEVEGHDIVYNKIECVLARDYAFEQNDGKIKILTGLNAGKVLDYDKVDDRIIHAYCEGRELKINQRSTYVMHFAKSNGNENFIPISKIKENINMKNASKQADALLEARYKAEAEKILDEEFNEAE